MSPFKQHYGFVIVIGLLIGSLMVLSASLSYASDSEYDSPLQTSIAGTSSAVRLHITETLNAERTKVAGTLNAVKTNVPATVDSVKTNVVSTVDSVKTNVAGTLDGYRTSIPATLTALAPTINAYRTAFAQTVTAFAPTADAFRTNIAGTATAYATLFQKTPISADDATAALTNYGATTLGITMAPLKATGADRTIIGTYPLPQIIFNAESVSANLATQTYFGTFTNGDAWLATGTGSVTGSGGTTIDVQSASLGVYSLNVNGSVADANSALALAKATYPDLAGLTYSPVAVNSGYAFYARTVTTVIVGGVATATPQTVVLFVLPASEGKVLVAAAVGSGEYSTVLHS
jgi:hypothetical protein